jgi:hypothetical protein
LILFGIPQIVGILGNIYMVWNISSDPASKLAIYQVFGVLFAVLVAYSLVWVVGVMKVKPFQPVSIDLINNNAIEFEKENKKVVAEPAK